MKSMIYGMLSETSIHPGTGQDAGLIDLPVAREKTTDYPVVVGSALKGAFRDKLFWDEFEDPSTNQDFQTLPKAEQQGKLKTCRAQADQCLTKLFGGSEDSDGNGGAGGVLISDARLLLLPIRSLTSSYYWVTCPLMLERCVRDYQRAGGGDTVPSMDQYALKLTELQFAGLQDTNKSIYLEEREFQRAGSIDDALVEFLGKFIPHDVTRARLASQLVILSNDSFSWFAKYGLPVTARNVLDRETKTSGNLWYEETLPCDSLFYCVVGERNFGMLDDFNKRLMKTAYVQVGGNETIGQGWFALKQATSQA